MTRLQTVAAVLTLVAASLGTQAQHGVAASVRSFHTPSGNIGCVAYGNTLRCDIRQRWWKSPRRPASCPLAYGDSLTIVGRRAPIWTCHGDTALHLGRVLPYGSTWHYGEFACRSAISGLTCTSRYEHGFFLSRQSYRLS
jgi:hypothetical protein